MPKKQQVITSGDVFMIPLEDGASFGVGQVVKLTPEALNSVVCCFFDIKIDRQEDLNTDDLKEERLISIQFTTTDLLKDGVWAIVDNKPLTNLDSYFNLEEIEEKKYIGVNVIGSSNIREFVSAYLGVHNWDCFYRDDYLDDLLLHPDKKPNNIYYSKKR